MPSKRDQGDIGKITDVFAELAGTRPDWIPTLKEIEMSESQVVREWMAEAREDERIQTSREILLRQAKKKFKKNLTAEDEQMISAQTSADVLSAWLDAVVEKGKYADFRNILRQWPAQIAQPLRSA